MEIKGEKSASGGALSRLEIEGLLSKPQTWVIMKILSGADPEPPPPLRTYGVYQAGRGEGLTRSLTYKTIDQLHELYLVKPWGKPEKYKTGAESQRYVLTFQGLVRILDAYRPHLSEEHVERTVKRYCEFYDYPIFKKRHKIIGALRDKSFFYDAMYLAVLHVCRAPGLPSPNDLSKEEAMIRKARKPTLFSVERRWVIEFTYQLLNHIAALHIEDRRGPWGYGDPFPFYGIYSHTDPCALIPPGGGHDRVLDWLKKKVLLYDDDELREYLTNLLEFKVKEGLIELRSVDKIIALFGEPPVRPHR